MHFNRKELTAAVTAATKTIAKRNPQPILACVRLSFKELSAEVIATDLEVWFKQIIYSGVATGNYAPVCLEAKQLLQVLKASSTDIVIVQTIGTLTTVDGMVIESYSAEDYPTMPAIESEHEAWVTMPAREMQRVIDQASWAAASYDRTSILHSVYFKSSKACATDGSRLSLLAPLDVAGKLHLDCMVPAEVLIKQVQPLLKNGVKANTQLRLTPVKMFGKNAIAIEGSNWSLITRLIDGEYPRYQELIPKQTDSFVTFDKAAMLVALKQIKPFVDKRLNTVYVDPETNQVRTDAEHKAAVVITMSPQLDATMSTDVVGWTCNYNYLLQVIESINCNTICMQYAGPNKPLVFRTNDYEHLLMPVQRVEDKRTYEAEVKSRKERLAQATG